METPLNLADFHPGDVFQINENGRPGLIGAFIMATEIRSWGIQGFVHHVKTFDEHASIFLRPGWADVEFIGRAVMMPMSAIEDEAPATIPMTTALKT